MIEPFDKVFQEKAGVILGHRVALADSAHQIVEADRFSVFNLLPDQCAGAVQAVVEQRIQVEQDTPSIVERREDGRWSLVNSHRCADTEAVEEATAKANIRAAASSNSHDLNVSFSSS